MLDLSSRDVTLMEKTFLEYIYKCMDSAMHFVEILMIFSGNVIQNVFFVAT